MNKLLQYMMDARNLDHRILPGLQKMQKGGKFKMPVATLTTNPEQSSNLSISTNVKSGTYRPTSKVITQAEIKKQEETARLKEEQDRKEALAAAVKRGRENQSYFSQDNRTAGEIENDRLRAIDAQMEQARSNSPFAQTLGSFTSSGYNPAAGRIAAENIGNMTPMMGATRLASTIKDPKNNPYGIGRDKGWFDNTLGTLGLVGDALDVGVVTAPILKQSGRAIGKAYNKVATGESALPVAWKSPAVGLSQEASDAMFKGIANTTKLTDADRALLLEYQYDSKPFTGRWGTVDQSKKDALNNLIKNNNLNFTNDAILTRKFNPTNKSLGAEFVDGTLNLGDRPSSFSAGVGMPGYGSGAVDRIVVPNRYSKQMGNSLLANEYNKVSDGTFDLLSGDVKNFAAARGIALDDLLNAEREVIGTGLNFKRIGKVKNDIGGYDHVVRPKFQGGGGFNARPTLKQIMQMPDKRYTPAPGVMNTKAGLAAASMMSGPFSFIPGTASAVYDLGTSARYAMDGQWDNAKEDLISAGLNAIPTAGVYAALAGMGKLQKAARARAAIRSAKGAMNAKDIAGSSTIRNNITGLVQEFDKTGKEISSMRPRSAAEVKAYNQNLKSQYRTGATPEGPAELMPFRSPDFAGGGMIVDPRGQWAHPGKVTRIPGSDITMKGVPYPVLGIGNNGKKEVMYPGKDYNFGGASYVDEYPIMQDGGKYFFMNIYDDFNKRLKNTDYVKDEYNKGMDFHTKWLNSPMYNNMINASAGSDAKNITDQRKKRLSAVTMKFVDDPYNKAGASADKLGNIEVYPEGIGAKGIGVHEMSHVTDTGPGQNLIPSKDRIDISRYSVASENLPKYEANNEYFNYVTRPSETRARLNEIRQGASENKLYDPFTQKVNPAIYNKLKNFKFNSTPGSDPLQQLKSAYSDEQILQMLNSVSKVNTNNSSDMQNMMKNGGYVVTRSNDRKGKTHKVTGPDGTVKYFGDSKLGQHPKDPERKKAFYARHKKNLDNNPYFRAFARKTWEEGGQTDDDREMLSGVADILRRINDTRNRKEVADYMMDNFREEDVSFEPNAFLKSANVFAKGGEMIRRADGSYSRRGLWDNIRANKGSGKKPTKQMLEQERKIRSKQEGGEEVQMPQSLEELMNPTRRGMANLGFGFNNEKFGTNYNYSGSDNFRNGTHSLNVGLPAFLKTGNLDISGTYSPGRAYSANIMGTAPANFIKKGTMMNFSGGFEKDINPMMKNVAPSYNVAAGFRIPTKVGNFTVNASYRK
jgi:hypothetical protein